MNTLSDDVSVKMPTTDMGEGYVTTQISYKGNTVFVGHSYVSPANSSLFVSLNDIATQNRGKYDYLKLNDSGRVESVEMHTVNNSSTCFNSGQIGTYSVSVSKDSSTYSRNTIVVNAYRYENQYIEPNIISGSNTELCRLLQGSYWEYEEDEPTATFNNLLLPHYPKVLTSKYGFGLQLYEDYSKRFSLRGEQGKELDLGYTNEMANQTFIDLEDLLTTYTSVNKVYLNEDSDTPVYLKLRDSSNDVFGHFVNHIEYRDRVILMGIEVTGIRSGGGGLPEQVGYYTIYDSEFQDTYLPKYMQLNPDTATWDVDEILSEQELYDSGWQLSQGVAQDRAEQYMELYGIMGTEPWTKDQQEDWDYLYLRPSFITIESTQTIEDYYVGNCPVAIIDNCYSRYYLAWNDRYGDIQSQAFDGKVEYSEDIETEEVKDYKHRRRVSHKTVQPKWVLNTKWLNERIYPIYESIFTSPYLLLYDSQQDKSWNVIVTDSEYKEKTYKTEKNLFNFSITVEANKIQNSIF